MGITIIENKRHREATLTVIVCHFSLRASSSSRMSYRNFISLRRNKAWPRLSATRPTSPLLQVWRWESKGRGLSPILKEDCQPTNGGVEDEATLVPDTTRRSSVLIAKVVSWVDGRSAVIVIVGFELMGGVLSSVELQLAILGLLLCPWCTGMLIGGGLDWPPKGWA